MTAPYYQDELVTLYHGDCREVMAGLEDASVDCVITDPPYDAKTHNGHNRFHELSAGTTGEVIAFRPFTHDEQLAIFAELGRISRGWVIATLAVSTAFAFYNQPPAGLRCLRVGAWVKPNPSPQITGDRPGQGWEPIIFLHRDGVRSRWNGGGKSGVWIHNTVQREGHPTVKPLPMVADWVRLFTNRGDLIFEPFSGSGTTLVAAKQEGRRAIGVELEEKYCELAARRLSQDTLFTLEEPRSEVGQGALDDRAASEMWS